MKSKKKYFALGAAIICGIAAFIIYKMNDKQAYDYSDYYIETKQKEDTSNPTEDPEKVLSLKLLRETNSDVVGILEFDNQVIYEPIVQAPDNEYYVRRNINKNYSAAGIPFVTGDGNIYSPNVVIYGHSSTQRNIIFTPLMNYEDKDYYLKHPTFKFETIDGTRTYQIISVLNFDTKDKNDSLEFTQTSWRKNEDYESFIQHIIKNSIYDTGVDVTTSDDIMTLITCDTDDGSQRVVVISKRVK